MGGLELIKYILLDLDGTLYRQGQQIHGAAAAVQELRDLGCRLLFLTNTDSVPVTAVHRRIVDAGIGAEVGEVFSPIEAALDFFARHPEKSCSCLVSHSLRPVFAGVRQDDRKPDYLLIGDMRDTASYSELNQAFRLIMDGAAILALSKGRHFAAAGGPCLDTGAFVTLFEFASGKPATVLGKPSAAFMDLALARLGARREEVLIVGDDPEADLQAAINGGVMGAMVRTGIYGAGLVAATANQPDLVLDSIADLPALLRRA